MAKFALIKCVNGNFAVATEHADKNAGIVAFHQTSASLWNASDVVTARLSLVDENLYVVDGKYTEVIDRTVEETEE